MNDASQSSRLAELEAMWRARFMEQPKLPSSALLTGAVAMALGFGTVLFLIGAIVTHFVSAWTILVSIFGALSLLCGITNRILARRWYRRVVIPWGNERKAMKAEIEALRKS
ncbi:MAG TPA: hypothetical protein VKX17_10745 [Planctomycetota bacterium]|nr:hypothetical protein [Planctomycetota bacterium]